jgi:hypothetical protein
MIGISWTPDDWQSQQRKGIVLITPRSESPRSKTPVMFHRSLGAIGKLDVIKDAAINSTRNQRHSPARFREEVNDVYSRIDWI